jgi:hypothetical protein
MPWPPTNHEVNAMKTTPARKPATAPRVNHEAIPGRGAESRVAPAWPDRVMTALLFIMSSDCTPLRLTM